MTIPCRISAQSAPEGLVLTAITCEVPSVTLEQAETPKRLTQKELGDFKHL
jgi:hypothetical protein